MLDAYDGFEAPLRRLHSHQVLAIERGKQREYLSVTVAIPSEHKRALKAGVDAVEKETRRELSSWYRRSGDRGSVTEQYRLAQGLIAAAEAEASSSLLKRRAAAAVWRESVGRAKARATAVFANNLPGVLLAPPLRPPRPVMAVDPGHAAGCKCASTPTVICSKEARQPRPQRRSSRCIPSAAENVQFRSSCPPSKI